MFKELKEKLAFGTSAGTIIKIEQTIFLPLGTFIVIFTQHKETSDGLKSDFERRIAGINVRNNLITFNLIVETKRNG